jgi:hypothetical protein
LRERTSCMFHACKERGRGTSRPAMRRLSGSTPCGALPCAVRML